MSVVVRPVAPADYEAVGALTVAAYTALPGNAFGPAYVASLRDVAGRAQRALVLVAVEGDALLGGVTYVPDAGIYDEFPCADEAGVRMLAVAPSARGRGVGAALMDACIDEARSAGKRRLVLFTAPWMHAAHRLYERLGFRRMEERDWQPQGVCLLGYAYDLAVQRGEQ